MKKKLLAMLALCAASLAQAGWFDSYNDEVPPGLKVERVVGGTDQWNATQFFTQSTFSRDGKPVTIQDDGHHFDGATVSVGKVRPQGATVCQKDNLLFYNVANKLFRVNLDKKGSKPELIWTFQLRPVDPEKGSYMSSASPTSITNDCTKIAVEYSYHVGIGKGTAATFHGTHEDRFRTSEADVYFGELKDGKWEFKLILASKQWLSHTQIEPVKGDRIIVYKDGPAQLVPESCYVMNTDGSDFHKVAEIPSNGMARLCQWMGDGKHILFKYLNMPSNQWGYMLADAYEKKVVGKVILPFEYNKLFHEIAPKMLKNGNVGAVGDAQEGTVYYAEFDFKAEKLVRWAKIAKYGERYLPGADEVWFPHPNISQDKKFVAFTSSNGQGKKGSDVFVVSGLPE